MKEKVLVKSKDFLAGYVYHIIEKDVIKALSINYEEDFPIKKEVSIPWAWCRRRSSCLYGENDWRPAAEGIMFEVANMVIKELSNTFDYVDKKLGANISITPAVKGWRSEICFEIYKLPEVKEMTIAEVESALGYKVKIVGDK